jgi:galactose oxidase-like protein/PKD domain-containing protein
MRTTARPIGWGWSIRALAGFIGLALAYLSTPPALHAQAGTYGQWRTLNTPMPINPVHAALMNNGKVLIVSGSGNVAAETNFRAAVLDPVSENITITSSMPWDMFCNGMVVLYDGRPFINGGNLKYDPFWGQPKNAVFDPVTGLFTDVQNMAHGRWYPTVTTLGDGRVMTFSGLDETSATNTTVEIYTVGSGWSTAYSAGWTPPLYPRMHLLPNGNVLYTGSGTGSRVFNTTTNSWSGVIATTNYAGTRTYGTSVLLPLRASEGYRARVMILGGGNPATNTTEIIDMSAPTPQWQYGPPMSQNRTEMNATILPNGKVLATGGSTKDEDATTQSLNADLFDTSGTTVSVAPAGAGTNVYARLYHSNSLLLPDATVLLLGGNPARGTYEQHMEIYSPAYLFDSNGNPALRPAITANPGPISYGGSFQIQTPDAADIRSVVLVRPGAPTHAFDMEQRLIELPYSVVGGQLTATAPPSGNIAPPGYYMLFILNSTGVPSTATFVKLSAGAPNQAPTASIDSPASNVTVNPGGSVAFSGSGSDSDGTIASYAWTFTGGSPAASSLASPSVTYSTPGSYQAVLQVTDNGGLASATVARTITVADFGVSATPSSTTVAQGVNAGYTATVTGGPGFTGTVGFNVTGLPAGASASFNPTTVTGSGSTALTVSTSNSTPAGTYTLTIRGTSGPVSHTTTVTLVVTVVGDFSIVATPSSQTVQNGNNGTYSVTIGSLAGFTSTVSLSVGALPKFVTASFSPASITGSGGSTLTLSTKKQTKPGSYTVAVTGTCGTLVHSYNVTLVVQ